MLPFLDKQHKEGAIVDCIQSSIKQPVKNKSFELSSFVDDLGDPMKFAKHDAALKFWLPSACNDAMNDLAKRDGKSQSESYRQLLFTHCYGIYAFSILVSQQKGIFRDEDNGIRFSRKVQELDSSNKRETTYWVIELGKNVFPVKLWIASQIKNDLQILADHVGIKLSQYIREIIISRLLGHGTLPKRPEMMDAIPLQAANDWCEDIEVPWIQVSEEDYLKAELKKCDSD